MIHSAKVPLHIQLANLLRAQIAGGVFKPGDQLPTEKELMEQHGVSSSTVRQAVLALAHEGLIYRRAGKGTFVTQPTVERDLLAFSSFTEEAAAKAMRATSQLVTARWAPPPDFVAVALGSESDAEMFEVERVRLADGLKVALETVYFARSIGLHFERHDLEQSLTRFLEDELGLTLERAHQVVRAASAPASVARLLDVRPGTALLQIERTAYLTGDRPCYVSQAFYRPDRYSYEGWIERQRHPGGGMRGGPLPRRKP